MVADFRCLSPRLFGHRRLPGIRLYGMRARRHGRATTAMPRYQHALQARGCRHSLLTRSLHGKLAFIMRAAVKCAWRFAVDDDCRHYIFHREMIIQAISSAANAIGGAQLELAAFTCRFTPMAFISAIVSRPARRYAGYFPALAAVMNNLSYSVSHYHYRSASAIIASRARRGMAACLSPSPPPRRHTR